MKLTLSHASIRIFSRAQCASWPLERCTIACASSQIISQCLTGPAKCGGCLWAARMRHNAYPLTVHVQDLPAKHTLPNAVRQARAGCLRSAGSAPSGMASSLLDASQAHPPFTSMATSCLPMNRTYSDSSCLGLHGIEQTMATSTTTSHMPTPAVMPYPDELNAALETIFYARDKVFHQVCTSPCACARATQRAHLFSEAHAAGFTQLPCSAISAYGSHA